MFYGLRYGAEWLATPVPESVRLTVGTSAPSWAVLLLMDRLVRAVLPPRDLHRREPVMSAWLLYVRSHWLRMPPWLLAGHLLRKAIRRLPRGRESPPGVI